MAPRAVTEKSLAAFRASLSERGLADGTMRLYVTLVRACSRDPRGMTGRLMDADLAAKSLRTNKAALMSWAEFAEDHQLLLKVKRTRLPPAVRAKPKVPFERTVWKDITHRIVGARELTPAKRAVLFLIAVRGLRVSDALRIRRADVMAALRTGRLSFVAKGRRRIEYDAAPLKDALEALAAQGTQWQYVRDLIVTAKCHSDGATRNHAAYKQIDRALRSICQDTEDVHAHRFRRTYATQFLLHPEIRKDPQAMIRLQQHMGWAKTDTAMQYVDAVNRDELDKIGGDLTKDLLGGKR